MPDTKTSGLGAAAALGGTEQIPGVQTGALVRLTPAQLRDYIAADATMIEAMQDMIATFLVAGTNVTLTYNDPANTLTVASTATGANMTTSAADPTTVSDTAHGFAVGYLWFNTVTGVLLVCRDPTNNAAVWDAQEVGPTLPMRSQAWYGTLNATMIATIPLVANQFTATPFTIYRRTSFDAMSLFVDTLVAASQCRLGVYADVGGKPDTGALIDSVTVSTAATGDAITTFGATRTLDPGNYWLAVLSSAAAAVRGISGADASVARVGGASTIVRGASTSGNFTGRSGTATFAGGLPTPFGASAEFPAAGGNTPMAFIRTL